MGSAGYKNIPIPHHRMLVEEPFEHSVATPTTTAPGGEA